MAIQCENCGKELFAGQRFCRYCGKPSGQFQEENIPTQLMSPQPDTRGSRRQADTAPHAGTRTGPVYTPPQQGYYQPPPGQPPMPVPAYAPPKPRSTWGWIVALVAIGLFGAMFLGFLLVGRSVRNSVRERATPPPAVEAGPGETALGEEGASVTSRETIITKSFPVNAESRFSINNPNGQVTIQGWDQSVAEVRIVKRGGSRNDRRATEVFYGTEGGNLKFRTAPARGRGAEVVYEVRLPRSLKLITIESTNGSVNLSDLTSAVSVSTARGDVRLTDITGDVTLEAARGDVVLSQIRGRISVSAASGSIDLSDIVGTVKSNTANGDIKAVFEGVTPGEPIEFSSARGDIDIEFKSDINADLDLETIRGDIEVDDRFQVTVEKQTVGQRARGRIGTGGQRLKINTVNGDIRVARIE
ncbi:MAG TPA: DUF4097 family beta strand repeat-containing protein [Blastocatellia bacterium]|nr:DUF4097 family beta strand repeat-containing protein [Blastocatellia bacterium]